MFAMNSTFNHSYGNTHNGHNIKYFARMGAPEQFGPGNFTSTPRLVLLAVHIELMADYRLPYQKISEVCHISVTSLNM